MKFKVYRSMILPVVLCGCETWHVTLNGEYRLRVFKNRVLMEIVGPKREEVTGRWTRLSDGELCDLYCL